MFKRRYVVGIAIVVVLLLMILILVLTGGSKSSPKNVPRQPVNVLDLANSGSSVRLITEGVESADSTYREIWITIGPNNSEYDVIQGYQGHVISSQVFANNPSAYQTFLYGLSRAGFSNGDLKGDQNERGHCALGTRWLYEVVSPAGGVQQKFWNDSCGVGTFKGLDILTRQLFRLQIPGYNDLVSNVSLAG